MKPFYLLFFLISLNSFAQNPSDEISLFTDYSECLYGFKTRAGDTLYPAQFDKAYSIDVNQFLSGSYWAATYKITHWLVSKNGKVGLLDIYGNEVFPVEYESLDLVPDSMFIFQQNGKKGLIGLDEQIVLANDFDRIDLDWSRLNSGKSGFYFVLVKSNKTGVYKYGRGIIIPLKYNYVSRLENYINVDDTIFLYQKWKLWENGQIGIADINGEILIPVKYDNVIPAPVGIEHDKPKLHYVTYDYEGDSVWQYEELTFTKVKQGLLDEKGKEVLPMEYDQIQLFHNQDENSSRVYVMYQKKKELFLKNLPTNKKVELSGKFVDQCGNYFIVSSKDMNTVYDADLNTVSLPDERMINSGYLDENSCLNDLFHTVKYVSKKEMKKAMKRGEDLPSSRNLYDIKEAKQLPKDYGWIKMYDYPEEGQFFLAFSEETIKVKYPGMRGEYDTKIQYLDIYDRSFNLITHLPSIEIYDWGYERSDDRYLVLWNEDGKMGVIGKNGKTYLDFEYDQIEPFYEGSCQFRMCDYLIEKDKKIGLWNSSKGILVTPSYDREPERVEENYVFNKDDQYDLIDTSGKVLLTSCADIFSYYLYDSLGNKVLSPPDMEVRTYLNTTYVVKNEKLYRYEDADLVLMDETTLDFSKGLTILGNYLVDRTGSVFFVGQSSSVQEVGKYYLVKTEDKLLQLDQAGTILKEFSAYAYNVKGSHLYVIADSGTGVWHLDNMEWLVETVYSDVIQANDSLFWVKEKESYKADEWKLRLSSGQLLEVNLDLIVPLKNTCNLFRKDGKFGLLDNQGRVVLEPENDYLRFVGDKWLFKRYDKWGVWSEEGNAVEPIYTDITWDWKCQKWWVWKGDQVGVLDEKLEWLIPLTNESNFVNSMSNVSLAENVMKSGYIGNWEKFNLLPTQRKKALENRLVWFNISNRRMTRANCPLYYSSTAGFYSGGDLFQAYRSSGLTQLLNAKTEYKQIIIIGFGGDFHTEELTVETATFVNEGYTSNSSREVSYETYKWQSGQFKRVALKELFSSEKNPVPIIYDMLFDEINKKQTFGASCLSNEFIDGLMERFSIGTNGLIFHQLRTQHDWIELSYDELNKKGLTLLF